MERKFPCAICGLSFPDKMLILEHFKTHTAVSSRKDFNCAKCKKRFFIPNLLKNHQCSSNENTQTKPQNRDKVSVIDPLKTQASKELSNIFIKEEPITEDDSTSVKSINDLREIHTGEKQEKPFSCVIKEEPITDVKIK